ncbi:hypothetical protein [Amycolatopsis circi]|uniref:hypothetical protein n=1 Tax=Amycolatopsis circi TaxID=871959 RepID=UPI0013BEA67C|nr:hypothetical protein [Amycolatopsis circi]
MWTPRKPEHSGVRKNRRIVLVILGINRLPAKHAAKPAGSQLELPLTFKNTSSRDFDLHGPVDSLLRRENGPAHHILALGRTAIAKITVLPSGPNPPAWTAQSLTIPPGQTKALKAAWPSNVAITRQDGAPHPGAWADGITADAS